MDWEYLLDAEVRWKLKEANKKVPLNILDFFQEHQCSFFDEDGKFLMKRSMINIGEENKRFLVVLDGLSGYLVDFSEEHILSIHSVSYDTLDSKRIPFEHSERICELNEQINDILQIIKSN